MQQNDSLAGGARNELQRLAHNLIGGRLEKLAETAKNHLELVEQRLLQVIGAILLEGSLQSLLGPDSAEETISPRPVSHVGGLCGPIIALL